MNIRTIQRVTSAILIGFATALACASASGQDSMLFDFEGDAATEGWAPRTLPGVKGEPPAPNIEFVASHATSGTKCLKLTFQGGAWPVVATTRIPIGDNWKNFQTLKADLTVEKPMVAYFRVAQGQPDADGKQPLWERTLMLQPGRNAMTLVLHKGVRAMDPAKGPITSFTIGAYQPDQGQTLLIDNVRLSSDWPPPNTVGWHSPYNHDGYSSAVAREYERTGKVKRFKVLSTGQEVSDITDLAGQLKERWVRPEARTIDQVESELRADWDRLRKDHPRAVMAILREGEKGWDPANAGKPYSGWKMAYFSCHGPDGPNPLRENTPALGETIETFMRHRSPLMQMDLASIPKDAAILSARLVLTRASAPDPKSAPKPNLWVAEPCNRPWDELSANCYYYAKGKHWKAVSGLYYGEDPDFWPVFLTSGPSGGGTVNVWDFTEGLKFWIGGGHENRGFFFYGDSNDHCRVYTHKAVDAKARPAMMVIYEPKS